MAYGPRLLNKELETRKKVIEQELTAISSDVRIVAKYTEIALDKAIYKGFTRVDASAIATEWNNHTFCGAFGLGNWDGRRGRVAEVIRRASKELEAILLPKYVSAGWDGMGFSRPDTSIENCGVSVYKRLVK
ncbi:MAG: hypothetical protein WC347_03860 [Smithellaceae bacterium]|jgi:hypothetical protein